MICSISSNVGSLWASVWVMIWRICEAMKLRRTDVFDGSESTVPSRAVMVTCPPAFGWRTFQPIDPANRAAARIPWSAIPVTSSTIGRVTLTLVISSSDMRLHSLASASVVPAGHRWEVERVLGNSIEDREDRSPKHVDVDALVADLVDHRLDEVQAVAFLLAEHGRNLG